MPFNTLLLADRGYPSCSRRHKRGSLHLLLAFLVAAILMLKLATADAASLTAGPASVAPGGTVTSSWSGLSTSPAWVLLYRSGSADTAYLEWRSATGWSGSTSFTIPATLAAGTYETRLFNSAGRIAVSNSFSVGAPATVAASPASVNAGSPITTSWSGAPATGGWVLLYARGAPDSAYLASRAATAGTGSGSLSVPATTAAGTYEVRLFATSGRLATSNAFTVGGGASADRTAPSVPTGLTGTALSSTQIRLNWNASSDNVGVKGYYVYLNDVALGTTTGTTYTHNGLTAGTTYRYRVSAYDAVPNHSAWTATPVAVTTPGGSTPPPATGYLPVIPGKAGYGMQTRAGRGGTVYKVTNLNASGTGSLRACTDASGPRVCVFEVSGNIDLGGSELNVYNPFLTIAGQTAPAPGISLINGSFGIVTHDVLVQHIRSRGGLVPTRRTPFSIDNTPGATYNVVIDHVSMAWSTDDLALTWWGAHDITWSHVLATGELNNTGVYFDAAGKVMLTDSGDYNIFVTDSALLTGYQRMPLAQANPFVFVNNVVYNWGGVATEYTRQRVSSGGKFVVVNNHYRTGPLHAQAWVKKPIFLRDNLVPGMEIYLDGNYAPDFAASQQWDLVDNRGPFTQSQMQATSLPAWPTGYVAKSAASGSLFETVLNNVGAFPLSRDSLDARLVSDARNRTGGYVTSTTFPTLANNYRALTLPANPNGDDNGNGYTNLEEWLHCMAAQVEGRAC
jgi:hypothetical protein